MTRNEVYAAAALTGAGLLRLLQYFASCLVKPKRRCWVCKDHRSQNVRGRIFGDCWWCGGAGWRLRYGKRIYDRWSGKKRSVR